MWTSHARHFWGKKFLKMLMTFSFYSVLAVCMLSHFIVPTVEAGILSLLMYLTIGLSCVMHDRQLQDVNSYLWLMDFILGPGMKPGPPALGVQVLATGQLGRVP